MALRYFISYFTDVDLNKRQQQQQQKNDLIALHGSKNYLWEYKVTFSFS